MSLRDIDSVGAESPVGCRELRSTEYHGGDRELNVQVRMHGLTAVQTVIKYFGQPRGPRTPHMVKVIVLSDP